MSIKESFKDNVAILEIHHNMMGGTDTTSVHEKVKALLNDGIVNIVIDLGSVKWMNSSGLGVLMSALASVSAKEGTLKIANAAEKINSLLIITQLTKVFHNYDSVDKAVASFQL